MSFSLIITVIVLIGAFIGMISFSKKQRNYPNAKIGAFVSFVVIIICCYTLLSELGILGSKSEAIIKNEIRYRSSICYVLGKKIAAKYPGKKVLVILRAPAHGESDATSEAMKESFNEAMEGSGCNITYDYLDLAEKRDDGSYYYNSVITGDKYNEVLEKNSGAEVVVSLTDLPNDPDEISSMSVWEMEDDKRPALYLTFGDINMLGGAIVAGLLDGLVIWKPGTKYSRETAPSDLEEAFNKRYVLVTKDNVSNYYTEE